MIKITHNQILKFAVVSGLILLNLGVFLVQRRSAAAPGPACSGAQPQSATITATSGSFKIMATGVADASNVAFFVWSEADSQDDLVTYGGLHDGGGDWHADIDLENHPGFGKIFVDVYVNYPQSQTQCASTNFRRLFPKPTVDIKVDNANGPLSVDYNSSHVVSWTTTNATSCRYYVNTTLVPEQNNVLNQANLATGNITNSNNTFVLDCWNEDFQTTDSVVVNIKGPTVDLKGDGSDGPVYIKTNTTHKLSWKSSAAFPINCALYVNNVATPYTDANRENVDTGPIKAANTIYRLDCTGVAGRASDTVQFKIGTAPATPPPTPKVCVTATSGGPVINSLNLSEAKIGSSLVIIGSKLTRTVRFYSTSCARYSYNGTVSSAKTETSIKIPADLPKGIYTVVIFDGSGSKSSNSKVLVIGDEERVATTSPTPNPTPPPKMTPPVITSISATTARRGVTTIIITGTDLTNQVRFIYPNRRIYTELGAVNPSKTQTTIEVPESLPLGSSILKIYARDFYSEVDSNGFDLEITGTPVTSPSQQIKCSNPVSKCIVEDPYRIGARNRTDIGMSSQCRDITWMYRNTKTATTNANDFTFQGIPASVWNSWADNEARDVMEACKPLAHQGNDRSEDLDNILFALEIYWSKGINRKGISCAAQQNTSICRPYRQFFTGGGPRGSFPPTPSGDGGGDGGGGTGDGSGTTGGSTSVPRGGTPYGPAPDCDPLPSDADAILECNFWDLLYGRY